MIAMGEPHEAAACGLFSSSIDSLFPRRARLDADIRPSEQRSRTAGVEVSECA